MNDDLNTCAAMVQRSDPERFAAAMTARPKDRGSLMVLYAFNLEIARAPWVTQEPMIAQMRLQWWFDAVEEIFDGATVRRHSVVTPLADLVLARGIERADLDAMITARFWDINKDAHTDEAALLQYLGGTGGALMAASHCALGGGTPDAARNYGTGCAISSLFRAVPALVEAGRIPLVDGRDSGVQVLAQEGLNLIVAARQTLSKSQPQARAALRAGWLAQPILKQAVHAPQLVGMGGLEPSEFSKRFRLVTKTVLKQF